MDATMRLAGDSLDAPAARRWVRHRLVEAGADVDAIERAAVLVSALLANAAQRAGQPVQLSVVQGGRSMWCAVSDSGALLPADARGHGLMLVDALAARWGADRVTGQRTTVWFQL